MTDEMKAWVESWIERNNAQNMSAEEIAKCVLHEAIENTVIPEEVYPNLRSKLHKAVDAY